MMGLTILITFRVSDIQKFGFEIVEFVETNFLFFFAGKTRG
jgi:hypothetical protein